MALKCVCEYLCFISIYFVHPLAQCVLRYQKSLREPVGCYGERKTGHIKPLGLGEQNKNTVHALNLPTSTIDHTIYMEGEKILKAAEVTIGSASAKSGLL